MDNQQRKDEIKRRLGIGQYPRRANAEFTDENNHNPLVLSNCPNCSGHGEIGHHIKQTTPTGWRTIWTQETCPLCQGSGTSGELEPYFDNDQPAQTVAPNAEGWVKCPNCHWKFALKDKQVWTGLRHKRCGQKLTVAVAAHEPLQVDPPPKKR